MREHNNNKHRKRKTPGTRENSGLGRKLLAVFPFLFSSFLLCYLVLELSFCQRLLHDSFLVHRSLLQQRKMENAIADPNDRMSGREP